MPEIPCVSQKFKPARSCTCRVWDKLNRVKSDPYQAESLVRKEEKVCRT
jgi:hypothetical protein